MAGVKLLRRVEPRDGTKKKIYLGICHATILSVYSRHEDAMIPRLSIAQESDEIIVEPCIARNQVARVDWLLLKDGEASGRDGLHANGEWTFEGIIEATDEEFTALHEAGYQLDDLRAKTLFNLLDELSGSELRHESPSRRIVLFDEDFVEKEWAGPLANERRERAVADERAASLTTALDDERRECANVRDRADALTEALAKEREKVDQQTRALAAERASNDDLARALADERASNDDLAKALADERAQGKGWFYCTLALIFTIATLIIVVLTHLSLVR